MESILSTELSILVVGLMAVLIWTIVTIRNVAAAFAGVLWSFSVILFIFAGLFGLGLELFWLSTIGTLVMIIVSMVVTIIA